MTCWKAKKNTRSVCVAFYLWPKCLMWLVLPFTCFSDWHSTCFFFCFFFFTKSQNVKEQILGFAVPWFKEVKMKSWKPKNITWPQRNIHWQEPEICQPWKGKLRRSVRKIILKMSLTRIFEDRKFFWCL